MRRQPTTGGRRYSPRALQRRARRLWSYWRAERRTFRQGLGALSLSTVAGFVAGLVLGSMTGTLERHPGLFILIPASIGMRGVISGAAGARLGTSIAAGLFEVSWRPGGALRRNAAMGLVLTLVTSLYVAILARLSAAAFGEPSIAFVDLVTISVIGGTLGSAIVLLFAMGLAVVSFRRGWDLDAVAIPLITAVGDMVTLPAIFLATLPIRVDGLRLPLFAACLVGVVVGSLIGLRAEPGVRRTIVEMVAVLVLVPILDVLAGTLLESQAHRLLAFPGLLIVIPPFVSQAGALGGILSSRLSSKLRIGAITPRGRPEPPAIVDGSIVAAAGVVVFALIGTLGLALAALTSRAHPAAATMIGGTVLAGAMLLPIVLLLGYYMAVGTARFGLDPDDHSVPLITGVMDLTGIVAFILAMSLLGVSVDG